MVKRLPEPGSLELWRRKRFQQICPELDLPRASPLILNLIGSQSGADVYYEIRALHTEGSAVNLFYKNLLSSAAESSSELIKRLASNDYSFDYVVLGSGPHGAAAAQVISESDPGASVLIVDQNQLGGQFASYGLIRPVFKINSGATTDVDLNPLGPNPMLRVQDITSELYPTNQDLGRVTATNSFFAGATGILLQTRVEEISEELKEVDGVNGVMLTLSGGGQTFKVHSKMVINASGLGSPIKDAISAVSITPPEFFIHFANGSNRNPMEKFKYTDVAVTGKGDTGKVIIELLGRVNNPSAYAGASTSQTPPPVKIYWIGCDWATKHEFVKQENLRYASLGALMPNYEGDKSTMIQPVPGRLIEAVQLENGKLRLVTDKGHEVVVDHHIDARGLVSDSSTSVGTNEKLLGPDGEPIGAVLGRRHLGVGPCAKLDIHPRGRVLARQHNISPVALLPTMDRTVAAVRTVSHALLD
jgi:hypothetical protein